MKKAFYISILLCCGIPLQLSASVGTGMLKDTLLYDKHVPLSPEETARLEKMRETRAIIDEGASHFYGKERSKDEVKAFECFSKADSDTTAIAWLAYMYKHGIGTEKNPQKSEEYISKAEALLSADPEYKSFAQSLIPHIASSFYGRGSIIDLPKDEELFERFALMLLTKESFDNLRYYYKERNKIEKLAALYAQADFPLYADCTAEYVSLLFNGEGTSTDYPKAKEIAEKSPNDVKSLAWLAVMYDTGTGVEKDTAKADEYVKKIIDTTKAGLKTAEQDNDIPFVLYDMYEIGERLLGPYSTYTSVLTKYPKNERLGVIIGEAAMAIKFMPDYSENLMRLYEKRGRGDMVFEKHKKAYKDGSLSAGWNVATALFSGKGIAKNEKQAFEIFKKLADMPFPKSDDDYDLMYAKAGSLMRVSAMYKNGLGVRADAKKAEEYLIKTIEHAVEQTRTHTDWGDRGGLYPNIWHLLNNARRLINGSDGWPKDKELAIRFYMASQNLADKYVIHADEAQGIIFKFLIEAEMFAEYESRLDYYSRKGYGSYAIRNVKELMAGTRIPSDPEKAFDILLDYLNYELVPVHAKGLGYSEWTNSQCRLMANTWLSYMYQNGVGTEANIEKSNAAISEIVQSIKNGNNDHYNALLATIKNSLANKDSKWPNTNGEWTFPIDYPLAIKYIEALIASGRPDLAGLLEQKKSEYAEILNK